MANSKTIAGLIGPTLIALAAALLINLGSISALAESVSHDPALVLMSGVLSFVADLAVVRVHNRRHESRSPRHTATSFIPGEAKSVTERKRDPVRSCPVSRLSRRNAGRGRGPDRFCL